MTAAEQLLEQLETGGLKLERRGDTLLVSPAGKLTPERCAMIRQHKAALVQLLETGPWVGWCRWPGGRWLPVVRAGSWIGAWRLLIPWWPAGRRRLEKIVIEQGRHPNDQGRQCHPNVSEK